MTEPVFDFASGSTAVLFQDKETAYRSSWTARACAVAAESGREFALLTPGDAALTLPLADLLSQPGRRWLATQPDGTFFDGFTGRVVEWDGETFRGVDRLAEEFLQSPARPDGMMHVRAETVHPASLGARIGVLAERAFREVTGSAPAGWGVHEPATEPWDPAAVTAFCFDRAPSDASLVVVGAPRPGTDAASVGVLTVRRTASGVHESLELLAEAVDPLDAAQLDSFGAAMHAARARTALLGHALGFRRLARPARFTGVSVPGCAVFGPETLKACGAPEALGEAGARSRLLGVAPHQSLLVRYPQEPVPGEPHPLEDYARLVRVLSGR